MKFISYVWGREGGAHGLLGLDGIGEHLAQLGAGVGGVGGAVGVVDFAHDEHVVSATQGVGDDCRRPEDAVREVALRLPGGGAIEGPVWNSSRMSQWLADGQKRGTFGFGDTKVSLHGGAYQGSRRGCRWSQAFG